MPEQPLEAGRELDALVAEKIMGWTKLKGGRRDPLTGKRPVWRQLPFEYVDTPCFSTDIAAAWEVVEEFAACTLRSSLRVIGSDWNGPIPTAWIWRCRLETGGANYEAEAETAPLAICRAAIQTVSPELSKK